MAQRHKSEKFHDVKWWLWVIPLGFLLVGIVTLADYGINWDTPYRMLRGQTLLHYMMTGQRHDGDQERLSPILFRPGEYVTRFDFLSGEGSEPARLPETVRLKKDFQNAREASGKRLTFYRHPAWDNDYFLMREEPGHPPLPEMLGAALSNVGYERLGIIDELSAYKIVPLLGASAGVLIVGIWVFEITGSASAAVLGSLFLATWPIFWAESHFNLKDPLQASLYAGAMWSSWHWVKEQKLRWWGMMTLFVSLAMSVKWNIIFMPVMWALWFFAIRKSAEFRRWFQPFKICRAGAATVVIAVGWMVATWPRAWADPLKWIDTVAGFYRTLGISPHHLQPDGWFLFNTLNLYQLVLLVSQAQEILLLLAVFGIIATIRKQDSVKTITLLLLWTGIPIARSMFPWVKSYSGMRQIMEVLPALAVLGGVGAYVIIQKLKLKAKVCFLLFAFCFLIYPLLRLHPNENVYFNHFVGGIRGAEKLNLIDLMVTYGNIYKQGVDWLNANAEKDAKLAIVDGYMFAASPLWLREDVSLSPDHFSGMEQQGEYLMLLRRPNDQAVFAQRYPERFLRPIHEIKVGGVSFLRIYKNDPEFVLPKRRGEELVSNFHQRRIRSAQGDIVDIDIGAVRRVTRIVVAASPACESRLLSPFADELVEFVAPLDSEAHNSIYGIHEKRKIGNEVEFWFPAEPARKIAVHIQSPTSCFSKGDALRVMALLEE